MTYSEGWKEWTGGACPVGPDVEIQVEYGPEHAWPGDISSPAPARVWGESCWAEPGYISKWRLSSRRVRQEFRASQEATFRAWYGDA